LQLQQCAAAAASRVLAALAGWRSCDAVREAAPSPAIAVAVLATRRCVWRERFGRTRGPRRCSTKSGGREEPLRRELRLHVDDLFDNLRAPTTPRRMVSFEHPLKGHWTLEFGGGVSPATSTRASDATFEPASSPTSLSHLVLVEGYAKPFITSFALAGVARRRSARCRRSSRSTSASTSRASCSNRPPGDLVPRGSRLRRSGLLAVPRRERLGGDAYHYSLGPGLAFSFEHSRVGLSFGASLFGEKNAKAGLSFAF
jgi:hypothetical protein